jgi:hypothetical protein
VIIINRLLLSAAMSTYQNANVVKIRIVVHTLGYAGWDKSRNHWSIYLILPGETASVRFNMSVVQGSDENGTFSATSHAYAVTNSQLTYFDYTATPGLKVGNLINLVYQLHRDRYRMTGSGNGCRFWVYVKHLFIWISISVRF